MRRAAADYPQNEKLGPNCIRCQSHSFTMMLRIAACGFLFICILALGTEHVDAGSSFLSPAGSKPQLGKPMKEQAEPKMTRRDSESMVEILEGQFHDIGDNKIMISNLKTGSTGMLN
ncbi:ghrelin-like [Huso huso]|uniref:Ghrelin-like n=1 Tax=Huso huso TaxID=61971 RepID=A0ABR0YYY0_HUSHU